MNSIRKTMACALACALPLMASASPTDEELQQLRADVQRLQVKLDGMETANIDNGFAGLKISGMIDPAFISSSNRRSAGFNFLNNFDAVDRGAAGQDSSYAFDNSFFGMMMLQLDKETENGTKFHLQLVPHKSASSSMNLGSIIHEATVSVPTNVSGVRVLAGQFADFTGYEYFLAHQTKLVTHNLLFDFTQASYYAGAGTEIIDGAWTTKLLVANMNQSSHNDHNRNPMLVFRTDYANSEFTGIGVTGQFGKYADHPLSMLSSDAFYMRGEWTINGQVNVGRWKDMAFNGGDARWAGVSLMAAYKLTPRLELVARADYLKNDKNGGGTIATIFKGCSDAAGALVGCSDPEVADAGAGDYRNGLGPTPQALADALASGNFSNLRGTNRSELTLGGSYVINQNVQVRMEYRYDRASQAVFQVQPENTFRRGNNLFAASVVATF